MAFGHAVWISLAEQLEKMYDNSAFVGYLNTQAGIFVFIAAYYFLHKWFWSQVLWLSFGSLRYVFSAPLEGRVAWLIMM